MFDQGSTERRVAMRRREALAAAAIISTTS
jgi:hypothetical protein